MEDGRSISGFRVGFRTKDPYTICETGEVGCRASRLGHLATEHAEVLRPAVRLYHNLTQILRLCLSAPFDPATAAPGLVGLLTRAADVPDFATLEAHLAETEAKVRASFKRILGASR